MKNKYLSCFHIDPKSFSISHRGAWGQVVIAGVLITILPSLILFWLWLCQCRGTELPPLTIWATGAGVCVVILLGYALLFKYPVSIVRLRRYLSILAGGEIPGAVSFSKDEDDLTAVQGYLERIIKMAEDRIQMLERHHHVELEAERQRVMVESIATMCHHMGQPATAMSMCLYRLRNDPDPATVPETLTECESAFNAISGILDKLRDISHYCSESYLHPASGNTQSSVNPADSRIIKA